MKRLVLVAAMLIGGAVVGQDMQDIPPPGCWPCEPAGACGCMYICGTYVCGCW